MNASITKNDLKKALSKPWSVSTCLLAQTAKRLKFPGNLDFKVWHIHDNNPKAATAMILFDSEWGYGKRRLTKLRKMLPIRIKL